MNLPGAMVHVPGGGDPLAALAAVTDLGVVAHPDDLELLLAAPLLECRDDPTRRFCGVVCTDGAGSVRPDAMADLDEAAFVAVRAAEQVAAAEAAGMTVVLLGVSSADARDTGAARHGLVEALVEVASRCRPEVVHTHDPADAHLTHVAVATAIITALRQLPPEARPRRLVGWEGWRGLGWLAEDRQVRADLGDGVDDALALARHHVSQLAGKRYDLAVAGRWQANATFAAQRSADDAAALALGVELTPLLDDAVDPATFLAGLVAAFAARVREGISAWW